MNTLRFMLTRLMEAAGDDGGGGDGGKGNEGDTAAIEQRAREMGWSPKDQWRGNPEGWIDASTFVQRGEQVLPILQANLRKRDTEVATLRRQVEQQSTQLQVANESIQVLTNLSTEQGRAAAKEKRRELLRQQSQARTDGNTELEIDLGEQIAEITTQIKAEPAAPKVKPAAAPATGNEGGDPTKDPAYQAFLRENSWFGTDNRRTALATAIGQELRSDPANADLVGKPFFDKVVAEVNKTFAPPRQTTSKVEGGPGNGAGGGTRDNTVDPASGKSYSDLPADAKAACERDIKRLVGEGRAFKTETDWRKHYVTMYFSS